MIVKIHRSFFNYYFLIIHFSFPPMSEPFIASLIVASLSLIGALFIGEKGAGKNTHRIIIPVAIGVFLGVIFFELIPETLGGSEFYGAAAIVAGFLLFSVLSHVLKSYHHHHEEDQNECTHTKSARMLLIGDAVHNIADGVVIVSAFIINPAVGIATTIGIALHEIPQEIAEYGVLIHSGYSKKQALFLNFLSASSIFLGVVAASIFVHLGDYLWVLTGLAAGNLLYIVASDMIPELNSENHRHHFVQTFTSTLLGLGFIVTLLTWSHEHMGHTHTEEEHDLHSEMTTD
jgi:zinc and cadmium transporter